MNEGHIYLIIIFCFFILSICMLALKMYNEFYRRNSKIYELLSWVFVLAMVVVGLIALINKI